jgi:hypothetical protein
MIQIASGTALRGNEDQNFQIPARISLGTPFRPRDFGFPRRDARQTASRPFLLSNSKLRLYVARGIEASCVADHPRQRGQRQKIKPRTNPAPSAVNTALVGFSRTYLSASARNVRTSSRTSPQVCSTFPLYARAVGPGADFKSSATCGP